MTLLDKTNKETVSYIGQKARETREKQNFLLRQVTAKIEVDTALISKTELRKRNLNWEQVIKLAQLLKVSEDEFISLCLCEKVIEAAGKEPLADQGIKKTFTKIKN